MASGLRLSAEDLAKEALKQKSITDSMVQQVGGGRRWISRFLGVGVLVWASNIRKGAEKSVYQVPSKKKTNEKENLNSNSIELESYDELHSLKYIVNLEQCIWFGNED